MKKVIAGVLVVAMVACAIPSYGVSADEGFDYSATENQEELKVYQYIDANKDGIISQFEAETYTADMNNGELGNYVLKIASMYTLYNIDEIMVSGITIDEHSFENMPNIETIWIENCQDFKVKHLKCLKDLTEITAVNSTLDLTGIDENKALRKLTIEKNPADISISANNITELSISGTKEYNVDLKSGANLKKATIVNHGGLTIGSCPKLITLDASTKFDDGDNNILLPQLKSLKSLRMASDRANTSSYVDTSKCLNLTSLNVKNYKIKGLNRKTRVDKLSITTSGKITISKFNNIKKLYVKAANVNINRCRSLKKIYLKGYDKNLTAKIYSNPNLSYGEIGNDTTMLRVNLNAKNNKKLRKISGTYLLFKKYKVKNNHKKFRVRYYNGYKWINRKYK